MRFEEGRQRVIIERVEPEIDGGRYAIKRVVGERVVVEADVFTDGHDAISCALLYRKQGELEWHETPMEFLVNDRWRAELTVQEMGRYYYSIKAWVDRFKSWSRDLVKRVEAGQDVRVDRLIGADLIDEAREHASGDDAAALQGFAAALRRGGDDGAQQGLSSALAALMARYLDQRYAVMYDHELPVTVDRERARFSTWYELFPRSTSPVPNRHGTFKDVEARLPYIASMGFDVLYLPPIHPIGRELRKGRNNNPNGEPDAPGSPWAIGAAEGGHKAIHPELGTLDDFRHLVQKAREYGIDIAMDIAFQCAPDHPYVKEHPEWFRARPDGTIQYAENPPKKYQDIYPFDFETTKWRELWQELKSVICFWIEQGVTIFRVDNPHTKAFRFWEWAIDEIKRSHPETIFLSEAFTRPKVMYKLAKLGFTQSYTYFAWRNTKWELTQYLTELTQTHLHDICRPNFWPNTPDILTEQFQIDGRATFMTRLVLAATLAASYGIYGPVYELCINTPLIHGKEEYLDSEKYEIKHWDLDQPYSLKEFIARVNHIRRQSPALQSNQNLRFLDIQNDQIIAYIKYTPEHDNVILTIVNLDPHYTQSGWVGLPLDDLKIDPHQPFQVHDLLTDMRYIWNGPYNYVELNPNVMPAHIFTIRRRVRSEHDFEYFS
ncbi:MAG: alpha-1,4-glucan--maltose-1-phosphate maltosyltransferase [Chloroflexales bacterium]|nr:alpha-1,4-glucan--maltose-1-phosphate maltosyltransferase [Chloroflexales bacterium]